MVWKSTMLFTLTKAKKHQMKHLCGLINDQHMNISQRLFKIIPNEELLTSRAGLSSYQLHTLVACSARSTNGTLRNRLSQTGLGFLPLHFTGCTGQPQIPLKGKTTIPWLIYILVASARNTYSCIVIQNVGR